MQIRTNASRRQRTAQPTRPAMTDHRPKGTAMDIGSGLQLQLMHEALSRARMRGPQDVSSEAHRSARMIAIRVRREQTRLLGGR